MITNVTCDHVNIVREEKNRDRCNSETIYCIGRKVGKVIQKFVGTKLTLNTVLVKMTISGMMTTYETIGSTNGWEIRINFRLSFKYKILDRSDYLISVRSTLGQTAPGTNGNCCENDICSVE